MNRKLRLFINNLCFVTACNSYIDIVQSMEENTEQAETYQVVEVSHESAVDPISTKQDTDHILNDEQISVNNDEIEVWCTTLQRKVSELYNAYENWNEHFDVLQYIKQDFIEYFINDFKLMATLQDLFKSYHSKVYNNGCGQKVMDLLSNISEQIASSLQSAKRDPVKIFNIYSQLLDFRNNLNVLTDKIPILSQNIDNSLEEIKYILAKLINALQARFQKIDMSTFEQFEQKLNEIKPVDNNVSSLLVKFQAFKKIVNKINSHENFSDTYGILTHSILNEYWNCLTSLKEQLDEMDEHNYSSSKELLHFMWTKLYPEYNYLVKINQYNYIFKHGLFFNANNNDSTGQIDITDKDNNADYNEYLSLDDAENSDLENASANDEQNYVVDNNNNLGQNEDTNLE